MFAIIFFIFKLITSAIVIFEKRNIKAHAKLVIAQCEVTYDQFNDLNCIFCPISFTSSLLSPLDTSLSCA